MSRERRLESGALTGEIPPVREAVCGCAADDEKPATGLMARVLAGLDRL